MEAGAFCYFGLSEHRHCGCTEAGGCESLLLGDQRRAVGQLVQDRLGRLAGHPAEQVDCGSDRLGVVHGVATHDAASFLTYTGRAFLLFGSRLGHLAWMSVSPSRTSAVCPHSGQTTGIQGFTARPWGTGNPRSPTPTRSRRSCSGFVAWLAPRF